MSVITYKCPNCGGELKFNPEGQNFKCEYCLSEFNEEELRKIPVSEGVVYNCPSCGAEIITDDTTVATTCYYCHNPIVMAGKLSGEDRPDWVIPFAIDKEKAKEIFALWMKKKRFLPKDFFSEKWVGDITGVYFPYLLYSCKAEAKLAANCAKVRTWREGDIQYTETKHFLVEREGQMEVSNMARNALKNSDRAFVESVLPYNMDELREFQVAYLSGFSAEKKDIEAEDLTREAEKEIGDYICSILRNNFTGYDAVSVQNRQVNFSNEEWRYALFPVWTVTYRDRLTNRIYYFVLNGQTGKTCGKLPVDNTKLTLFFFEIFTVVFLFFLIVGYLI